MSERKRPRLGVAGWLTDLIAPFAPALALRREASLVRRQVLRAQAGSYDAASRSKRASDFRRNRSDAVEALRWEREPLSWIGRDMLRNNPRVVRIRRSLVGQVIGAGIQPAVKMMPGPTGTISRAQERRRERVEQLVRAHCMTTAWDADGMRTMLGQQALGFGAIVIDGEVLFRRRRRRVRDGWPLPFQVQVLEADYLDRRVDGVLRNGNRAVQGVEFNLIGQRVAYHLFTEHPGGRLGLPPTVRVDAADVVHAFDAQRPGQVRGVTWLAPVMTLLHELQKYQDGQVKRQEIASLFAAVLKTGEQSTDLEEDMGALSAGSVLTIAADEEMTFTDPPGVDGYEPFMRVTDRVIAAAMGLTYEALTGDYSTVNYTSGRMGRMDVDPVIKDWQHNLMIALVCHRFAAWIAEAVDDVTDIGADAWEMTWTPPVRPVVDPTKDYKANAMAIESGQKSRRQTIRESGNDPAAVEREIAEERAWAQENGVTFGGTSTAPAEAPQDDGQEANTND